MVQLTAEQHMLVNDVRELAEAEFADRAFEWYGEIPWENVKTLSKAGYYGISFAEEYGGQGGTEFETMLVIETLARVCPDTAYIMHNQHFTAPHTIYKLGSDTAKEKYLQPVLDGEEIVTFAVSEPDAGSDVQAMRTTIEERDSHLVLNGEKTWVGNVSKASAAVVWARFPEGLGSVVVDLDDSGVDIIEKYTNMSGQEQTHFRMNDVHVPDENVLARGKDGFLQQVDVLNWDRVGCAAMANGQALAALDRALTYAQEREQFGQAIGDFQGIEWKLADAATDLQASRALTYLVTQNAVQSGGTPERMHAAMIKLFSSQRAEDIIDEALQIHGAKGYQRGHPLEYLYRVGRRWRIAGGTDEIQRNTIAKVLKKRGLEFPE